jgi:hypothetical protein
MCGWAQGGYRDNLAAADMSGRWALLMETIVVGRWTPDGPLKPLQRFRSAFLLAGEQVLTIIISHNLFTEGVVVKVLCVRCRWAAQEENAFAS